MKQRWLSSGYLRAAPIGEVDYERGIINGVSVCTVGEAKGHGVNLDAEFLDTVARFGNARKQGLKARFGHPNMCSTALGTFIGRFKNFAVDGDQVRADLFLSNEAKDTPHGNLYDYVMGMARNEPDMFGTSIVFTPGATYKRDKDGAKVEVDDWTGEPSGDAEYAAPLSDELYVECAELHACDAVDDPAANDGLFSRFSQETIAGQVTEFLDLHPHVWNAIRDNPDIVAALARYGDKVDEFVTRYRAYRAEHKQESDMQDESTSAEAMEDGAAVAQPDADAAPETQEQVDTAETADEALAAETDGEPLADETPDSAEAMEGEEGAEELEAQPQDDAAAESSEPAAVVEHEAQEALSREEFCRIADDFGADVAAQVMRDGGDYNDALRIAYDRERDLRERAESQVAELTAGQAGRPAPVVRAKETKGLFNTGK